MKQDEIGRARGTYGGEQKCILGFDVKTWRKDVLGRPRHSWEDNIKIFLKEIA
jgi:hypothetical protein